VWHILTNPLYKGVARWGKRRSKRFEQEPTVTVEMPHLAIVSTEVWDSVQRKLKQNARRSARNTKATYLLGGGLLKCASCGASYQGRDYKLKNDDGRIYVCIGRTQYRHLRRDQCDAPILRADKYEEIVWRHVVQFADHPDDALEQLARRLADQPRDTQERADKLTSALNAVKDSRKRTERLAVRGVLTDERLNEELAALARAEEALQRQWAEVKAILDEADSVQRSMSAAERLLADIRGRIHEGLTPTERRAVLADAVRWILVEPGENGWVLRVHCVFGEVAPTSITAFTGFRSRS
jgi:hypothetical protein